MPYKLGPASRKKLEGLHPNLVAVVNRAIEVTTQDFTVLCGVRTLEEQKELYAQGRTKPGDIVTWTLNSRHLPAADGLGRAVDLAPYPIDWKTLSKFDAISAAMMQASNELGIPIRWGADWDQDGIARERGETDSPHFELA
jgi:peptidoglycan L-alanyl-D-glutamate endopeptidase CwlK